MTDASSGMSCYVLEHSVGPGGARKGDVFAHGDLRLLRECVEEHEVGAIDPYLIMWYGTMLHMWVFDRGTLVSEFDLHPFLRTGNDVWDRTLARLISVREGTGPEGREETAWKDIDMIMESYGFECVRALPLLTRVFDLRDRALAGDSAAQAEYEELVNSAGELVYGEEELADAPSESADVEFTLDWDAIAAVAPPLTGPVLTEGWTSVALPPELWSVYRERQSYLTLRRSMRLHAGWNDLEFGYDDVADPDD